MIYQDYIIFSFWQGKVTGVEYESKQNELEGNITINNKQLNIGWYRETRGRVPSPYIKHYLRAKEYGGLSGTNPWGEDDDTQDNSANYEEKQYFFHPDHLGSTNYLTDVTGEAYQHVAYLPWGEVFVEQRNTQTSRNTFLYTGKELDEETGLCYYEQRYYDPNKSYFLGVDPMADERSWVSPYSYCQNSPIIRTDPDGALDDWFMNEKTGDVYYNSEMRKGDEGTGSMTGEGWVHMGENGMFSDKTPQTSDVAVLYQNANLTSGGVKSTPVYKCAPIPTKEATKIVGYKFQAYFKGKNAETFMSGKGYDKKPLVANVHTNERSWSIAEPHGPVWQNELWESIESASAWRYIPKGVKGNYSIEGYYKRSINSTSIGSNSYTRQTWETRRYDYSKSPTWEPGAWEQLFFEVLKNITNFK